MPLKPILYNLTSNISWFTVSKAFLRSKKRQIKNLLLEIDFIIVVVKSKMASDVLELVLNPICLGEIKLWVFTKSIKLPYIFFSKILLNES